MGANITLVLEESDETISTASLSDNATRGLSDHFAGGNQNKCQLEKECLTMPSDSDSLRRNGKANNIKTGAAVENQNLTEERNPASKCLQIDFSHLSNSGTGDLFIQSMETDEALPKWFLNHVKDTDDLNNSMNNSMDVLVPCRSLSPGSRAR